MKVKEHNQSLVDDNIVLSDKIGSSVFFWSFKSQDFHQKSVQLDKLISVRSSLQGELTESAEKAESLKKSRCNLSRRELVCFKICDLCFILRYKAFVVIVLFIIFAARRNGSTSETRGGVG